MASASRAARDTPPGFIPNWRAISSETSSVICISGFPYHYRRSGAQAHSRMQVGDDDARHGSEAEPPVSLPVLFEVLPSVVQPNLMLLQESVQFIARFEAEQKTELGRCHFAFTVSLESDGFEGGAREVRSRGSQSSRKLIGQIECELHGPSIAKPSPECIQNRQLLSSKTPSLSLRLRVRTAGA